MHLAPRIDAYMDTSFFPNLLLSIAPLIVLLEPPRLSRRLRTL